MCSVIGLTGATLGERVRHARLRKGSTREGLAVEAGISFSAIAQIESGRRRNIRPDTLLALARALGVTTDYLAGSGAARPSMLEHRALIYGSDEEFIDAMGPFVAEGIERGDSVLVATSDGNNELVREFVGPQAKRVEFRSADEMYADPDTALATHREFVEREFRAGASWIRTVAESSSPARSKALAARYYRFEALMNLVLAPFPATVVCPKDERETSPSSLRLARQTHPELITGDTVEPSREYVQPETFVL